MSVDLSWSVEREDGVGFVACRVHNAAAVSRRVRVRNRTDATVLPPRRSGVPEGGWDAAGVTLRLESDERRAVGFAVVLPAGEEVADPPVEITDASPIDDVDSPVDPSAATANAAVRSLGDHRPPRDALVGSEPAERLGVVDGNAGNGSTDDAASSSETDPTPSTEDDASTSPIEDDASTSLTDGDADDDTGGHVSRSDLEGSRIVSAGAEDIDDRLERAERRIERAERLTDADLATATDAVDRLGGVTAVATLAERVADDAATLRRLSERASSLAARAEGTDVPTEALERLA
ncbi:hypothetical protein SAMN04488066_12519 [Halorubrum aquaticum]|uniref:DUF8080 domain-containing protein n=1 Tax=Halorubrum aquaticum TaxID=387340 RepID=A0A1I3CN54_9EURY|nr:hypothetical protein [Halorubrum aquaticum]SFH75818.1 hypothetical protein SAMN04488066_12519 [Halorubrum aquaticum]